MTEGAASSMFQPSPGTHRDRLFRYKFVPTRRRKKSRIDPTPIK